MHEKPNGHHTIIFQSDIYLDSCHWNTLEADGGTHLGLLAKVPKELRHRVAQVEQLLVGAGPHH